MHRFSTPGTSSRWCFRVPRRVGNAPTRNRVRRLMREFIRTHKDLWPVDSAVVLTANLSATELSFQVVSEQLERLLVNE
jgi:ribonuclease P protein component